MQQDESQSPVSAPMATVPWQDRVQNKDGVVIHGFKFS